MVKSSKVSPRDCAKALMNIFRYYISFEILSQNSCKNCFKMSAFTLSIRHRALYDGWNCSAIGEYENCFTYLKWRRLPYLNSVQSFVFWICVVWQQLKFIDSWRRHVVMELWMCLKCVRGCDSLMKAEHRVTTNRNHLGLTPAGVTTWSR